MEFTEFMIEAMAGKDDVSQALIVWRRGDGTIGYKALNQQAADSLGLLRFAALSIENDLLRAWRED